MAKVRVAVLGTVGKSVLIDDSLPGRMTTAEADIAALKRAQTATRQHSTLEGLQLGNDHPQYPMKKGREAITGQWNFTKPIWISDGTAALPAISRESDPNSGPYWIGGDNLGLSMGGTLRWDISTTRVNQTVYQNIVNSDADGGFRLLHPLYEGGVRLLVIAGATPAADGIGAELGFWENNATDGYRKYGIRLRHTGELNGEGNLDIYRHNNDVNGSLLLRVTRDTDQFQFNLGTEGQPIITPLGDLNTGFYFPAVDSIGASTGGNLAWRVNTVDVRSFLPMRGAAGSAAAPTFSWAVGVDSDSGMYSVANGQIGWSIDGTNRWILTATALTSTVLFQGPSGSAGSPTYSTSGDPNTGGYNVGADNWGISTGGTLRWDVSTTRVTSTLPHGGPAGSAGTPTWSFSGDTNTGPFSGGSDIYAIATAGTERIQIGPNGEIGLSGANYGTDRQVIISKGPGLPVEWASGGGGSPLVYVNTSVPAGNTVANTAADTAFTSSYTIPAGQLDVGTVVRVKLYGVYSTDAAAAPTIRLRLKLGATTMIDTGAVTTVVSTSNRGWSAEATFTVTTDSATGVIEAQGFAEFETAATTALIVNMENIAAVSPIDTTSALALTATLQWGTADADNTATLREMTVEVMNTQPVPATATNATFLTVADETAVLPSSRRLLAGSNVTFDDSAANIRTISVTAGATGSITFLQEVTLGAAATTIGVTGLDIGTDECYMVELAIAGVTTAGQTISFFANGDSTAGNYRRMLNTTSGSNAAIGGLDVAAPFMMTAYIRRCPVTGKTVWTGTGGRMDASTGLSYYSVCIWQTSANLTSFNITSSAANGIQTGSRVRVWKVLS